MKETDEDDDLCGYSYHYDEVTEEVDGYLYWTCRECGAEGEERLSG